MMWRDVDGTLQPLSADEEAIAMAMVMAGTALKRTASGGREVLLSPEQEALVRAQWAANEDAAVADTARAGVIAKLELLDRQSIRAMREYLAKVADAPDVLKAIEAEAITERDKLTPSPLSGEGRGEAT